MIRLPVDPEDLDEGVIALAADAIRDGRLVVMPTDTLYGLAADPFNVEAVRRIFAVKGRAEGQPLSLVAADARQVSGQIAALSPVAARLARRFWPGPLTLVLPAPATLGREVTGGTGTVGIRVPAHAVTRALCRASGTVLTATSANLSGAPASADPDEASARIADGCAVLLDAGPTPGGPASTILDVTGDTVRQIRAGAVSWEEIAACLQEP